MLASLPPWTRRLTVPPNDATADPLYASPATSAAESSSFIHRNCEELVEVKMLTDNTAMLALELEPHELDEMELKEKEEDDELIVPRSVKTHHMEE